MKRFLSLVLTLVMVMSLVTVSAGAKDFTDDESITYDEAVAVVSTIGVVDGYPDGSFKPSNTLTRQAAAKIICNLILGPTTAAELHADTAPYKDVPANGEFAGYIAYCQSRGIISGYADGNFRPGNTLTGYAFMKMLLGALGYDSALEGYVGANWSINVAKQALGIGLNKGLVDEFNGIKAVTREEACLYAFRTLQADLVEYGQRLTTNVNGTEVTLSSGGAKSREWNSQQSRYDYIRADNLIQFAEEYFNKLEKRKDRDDFERPAYTWIYDKEEIGTYVDWELLVERYTTGVSGRDLYDLLGATALKDNDFVYYVNGVVPSATHPMSNAGTYGKKTVTESENIVVKKDIVRSNKDDVGITANGVLTEVFLDKDLEIITITSIDTFLAKTLSDYNESKEYAPLEVYTGLKGDKDDKGGSTNKETLKATWNVDIEDVKTIEDVKEGDYKLVNITFKYEDKGEIVTLADPDIMDQSTVTKFSATASNIASKVTVGGTEYKAARIAVYSDDALDTYDDQLLTDKTYNVYMDPYGYFIGIELYEGAKNYVFITGFDRPTSNLAISTAKANGIFLDGTMQNITVNVKATNDNIDRARKDVKDSYNYFISWNDTRLPGQDGSYRYNRWFTYSVNADGVYTLKPCVKMTATKYTKDDVVIKTDNLYVDDNVYVKDNAPYGLDGTQVVGPNGVSSFDATSDFLHDAPKYPYPATRNERSYGEDNTNFIIVSLDESDTSNGARAITDVDGVYTGVQNVEIEIEELTEAEEAQIYTVYDGDHFMIGAVVVGEAKGSNANIAYVTSKVKSERIEGNTYYWEFDAILDGTEQTLTAKSDFDVFTNLKAAINDEAAGGSMKTGAVDNLTDGLVELRFDADDYVVDVKQIAEKDIYNFYGHRYADSTDEALKGASSVTTGKTAPSGARASVPATEQLDLRDAKAYRMNVIRKGWLDAKGGAHYMDSALTVSANPVKGNGELSLQGRTLYITRGQIDEGLALASDCKAVVIQKERNKDDVLTEFASVETALKHLADADPNTTELEFDGEVIAVMNDRGAASWVVFKTERELYTNTGSSVTDTNAGKYYKATSNIFENGFAALAVEIYRPEWLDKADTDALGYSFDIYVNDDLYQAGLTGNVASGATTATKTWDNSTANMFLYRPIRSGDKVTVKNFRWTNLSTQTYVVKYVDEVGNAIPDSAFSGTLDKKLDNNYDAGSTAKDILNFTLNNKAFAGGPVSYKVIGVSKGSAGSYEYESVASLALNTDAAKDVANGKIQKVVDKDTVKDLEDYVYVEIDTSSLTDYAGPWEITLDASNTPNVLLKQYDGVASTETETLAITLANNTALPNNSKFDTVNIKVAMSAGAPSAAYAYKVEIDGFGEAVVTSNTPVSLTSNLITVTESVKITKDMVTVTPVELKQDIKSASWDATEQTVTIVFAEKLATASVTAVEAWASTADLAWADGSAGNTAAYHSTEVVGGKTAVLHFTGMLAENNTVTLVKTTGKGLDVVTGITAANKCDVTEFKITLGADGACTVSA